MQNKSEAAQAREERLAANLRANLKRRKQQVRARNPEGDSEMSRAEANATEPAERDLPGSEP